MPIFRQIAIVCGALLFLGSIAARFPVAPAPDVDEVYPLPFDWTGLRVLHIGDSHVYAGLTSTLRKHLRSAGARYTPVNWIGSRSKSWVASGKLRRLLDKHSPNVVIVTLGTNAMKIRNPKKYAHWIRALVRRIGPRTCYWMGPPSLLEDRFGFNEILAEASAPCSYFDTRKMGFPKREDHHFHLTRAQGERWGASTWEWMNFPENRPASREESDAL